MKNFSFVVVLAAASVLLAGEASATKIDTSRPSVDQECGKNQDGSQKSGCNRSCGRSQCHYHCDGDKCTVTVSRKVPAVSPTPTPPATTH